MQFKEKSKWNECILEKCCRCFDNKRKPISSELREKGSIPYYGANGIQDYVRDYIFDGEYILLAEDGGHFDEFLSKPIAQYITGKSWVNNHAHVLQGKNDNITQYIFYSLVHKDIRKYINGSSRAKLNKEDMWQIKIFLPETKLQQKIADFLSLVDQRIEKQRQLVESLKKYKRGYFQRIISSLETSSFELKNIVDEYNVKSKIQNEFPILSSTLSGIKLQNDYFNKQAASETTIGYKIVPFGYFTYRSMSDTGEFRFNLQNIIEKGIVSPAYPVFKVKDEYNSEFVEYILNETDKIKSQLLVKKEGGTRYALSFSKFQTLKIDLPTKNEQDKMVSQLKCVNKTLANEEGILFNLQKLKNGLLQQMFI